MKELDSFTVEEIEEIISSCQQEIHNTPTDDEMPVSPRILLSLARIALAAKRAEGLPGNIYPDISGEITALEKILKWILNLEVPTTGATNRAILLGNTIELLRDCQKPIVATPQLNSPQGWIKCSDQMPEDDDFVRIWPLPDFGVELHVGQYIKFHKNGPGWFAQVYEHNYGVNFYPITVTHWMPLLAAPEKPL